MSNVEGRPARAGKLNGDELIAVVRQLESDVAALLDQRAGDAATIQRQKDELTKLASDNQILMTAYEEVRRICERLREENHRLRTSQPADDGYTYYYCGGVYYRQRRGEPLEVFGALSNKWLESAYFDITDRPDVHVRIAVSELPAEARP
ncbi:hypothetical protein [Saccharomonospora viridis]|uniref:hypothetical protein n=1 Tax=Saccharomonospora viridis TaxID=1852 RepID=UPI002408FCC0|nr:hypothetical protein [Saccharomonospora viridis]